MKIQEHNNCVVLEKFPSISIYKVLTLLKLMEFRM